MTYFDFTPPVLRERKQKTAIVYLHEHGRFDAWLVGNNRNIQAAVIDQLSQKNIGCYQLSQVHPGVDSIIETILIKQPDFDKPENLKTEIEIKTIEYIKNTINILDE